VGTRVARPARRKKEKEEVPLGQRGVAAPRGDAAQKKKPPCVVGEAVLCFSCGASRPRAPWRGWGAAVPLRGFGYFWHLSLLLFFRATPHSCCTALREVAGVGRVVVG
ncbi:uncharacterized protein Tco025E_08936, partial [Trypanosoma conorhini]